MTPAQILLAFLAVMAPCAIFFGGRALIERWSLWRESRVKMAQDMEFAAHEERLAFMNQYANKAARHNKAAQRQQSSLRVVPKSEHYERTKQYVADTHDDFAASVKRAQENSAAWEFGALAGPLMESPQAPAASYSGNGGTFDGGGASADWSSSDSGCSSSDSGSSDSGSCGSGD